MNLKNFAYKKRASLRFSRILDNLHSFQDPTEIIRAARFSLSRNLPNPFKFNDTAILRIFQRKSFLFFWKKIELQKTLDSK